MRHPEHYRLLQTISLLHAHWEGGIVVPVTVVLRARLEELSARSPDRLSLVQGCADLHGVSIDTIYRALREQFRPRSLHRRDRGAPRKIGRKEMEQLCEVIAALKVRTTNLKQRHLSTGRAIELLVETGIDTPDGLLKIDGGVLSFL